MARIDSVHRRGRRSSGPRCSAVVAGLLTVALALTACGGAGKPASAGGTSAAAPAASRPAPSTATGTAALTPLAVSYAAPIPEFSPLYVAVQQGFFRKYGLDPHVTLADGSVASKALLAGQIQVCVCTASLAIDADVGGGHVVLVGSVQHVGDFSLYALPAVRSMQDLVGRKLAVSKPGTAIYTAAQLILAHYKLLGKVSLVSAGSSAVQATILAMLSKGLAAGGILPPPFTIRAQQAGYRLLADSATLGIPFEEGALIMNRSYVTQHPKTVVALLDALRDAMLYLRSAPHRGRVEQIIEKYTHATPSQMAKMYSSFLPEWQSNHTLTVNPAGVSSMLPYDTNPKSRAEASYAARYIDNSFARKVGSF